MKIKLPKLFATLCLASLALVMATPTLQASLADAAPQNLGLTGNTATDGWANFSTSTMTGYGGFPGTGAWTGTYDTTIAGTLGSNTDGSGDALLSKVSNGTGGGPYVAAASIYYGGMSGDPNINGGTLRLADATPLAGLETITLQLQIAGVYGYTFYNNTLPTLTYTYNDGTGDVTVSGVAANYSNILVHADSGLTSPMGDIAYVDLHALQWDLSSVAGEIASFSIEFTAVQHTQLYGARVDQGDTMTQVVPEPSTYAMLLSGVSLLLWRQRRRGLLA